MPVRLLISVSVSRPPLAVLRGRPRRPAAFFAPGGRPRRPPVLRPVLRREAAFLPEPGGRPRRFAGRAAPAPAAAFLRGRPRRPAFSTLISLKTGSAFSGYRCLRPWPTDGIRLWYVFL